MHSRILDIFSGIFLIEKEFENKKMRHSTRPSIGPRLRGSGLAQPWNCLTGPGWSAVTTSGSRVWWHAHRQPAGGCLGGAVFVPSTTHSRDSHWGRRSAIGLTEGVCWWWGGRWRCSTRLRWAATMVATSYSMGPTRGVRHIPIAKEKVARAELIREATRRRCLHEL
jgi:hypothetical protein